MKNFKRFISAFLVLVLALSFLPELSVKAEESVIDLVGDSVPATTSTFRNGISYCQTGYLCYLLTEDGNAVPGTSAKLYKCAGFHSLGGGIIRCTSRKGGYSADHWDGVAPWEVSPFNADRTTNAEAIRAWIKDEYSEGVSNGNQFVADHWGNECMQKFIDGDYILVMETVLHFQYTLKFTYKKSVPLTGWKAYYYAKLKEGNPSIPYAAADGPAMYYYNQAQAGTEYKALFGSPFVGTVRDCLNYFHEAKADAESTHPFISVADTNYFSRYLNQVACFAERIGSGSAGERAGFIPYTGSLDRKLTNAEVMHYGVGMLVISSRDDDIAGGSTVIPDTTTTPSDYDGTVYTLTATGGSSSSGSGSSATTYFGNGSGSCLSGSLYAENCASGTDAYNLADSMKRGMSYDGDVPPVVFSGTSYDLSVDSSLGIVAGMLTVDPSTFPYVDISSTDASGYSSYLSAIQSGIEPSIDRCYDGRVSGTYVDGTMDCSPVIGGASDSREYSLQVRCTLTKDNCSPSSTSSPTWEIGGEYNLLSIQFARVYYNYGSATADQGKPLLEGTDLMRAFRASYEAYVAELKESGALQAYWTAKMNEDRDRVVARAGNEAMDEYKRANPEPSVPTEPTKPEGMTDDEWEETDEYIAWRTAKDAHDAWEQSKIDARDAAREARGIKYDTEGEKNSFSVNYASPQYWVFKFYWCSPVMQESYLVDDKIPIDDGPARGKVLFDDAWRVLFKLYIENNAHLGEDVLHRIIVNLPYADSISTVTGEVTDIPYFLCSKRIPNADFLLPDATSMDMR